MSRLNRPQANRVARLRRGFYDAKLPTRYKVCPNLDCPKPWRTYAYVTKCPFCDTSLEYGEE